MVTSATTAEVSSAGDSVLTSATAGEVTSAEDSVAVASAFASDLPSAAGGEGLAGGLRSGY